MNSRYLIISAVLISILDSSCSKKLTSADSGLVRSEIGIDEVQFDYLSIKSKIEFKEASSTKNATALIRLKKDSVIWFNLSGTLGVQGLRGIMTQDSLKMVNRVDKEYFASRYMDYWGNRFGSFTLQLNIKKR